MRRRTPSAMACLFAALLGATAAGADCRERERLDRILNVDPAVWAPAPDREDDPLMRMYDIAGPWAVAVAIGDYAGAEALAGTILPEMDRLFETVDENADPASTENVYARTVISGVIARVALVGHRLVRAVRYGLIARDNARKLAELDPDDPRPDFFLGLFDYYTGLAPAWVRAVGALAGIDGDTGRGIARLEAAVSSGQPLAPEAARVLLEETRSADRPVCRYLPLARDLAARYPDNFRFSFYVSRERERCPAGGIGSAGQPPRLAPGCLEPATAAAVSRQP